MSSNARLYTDAQYFLAYRLHKVECKTQSEVVKIMELRETHTVRTLCDGFKSQITTPGVLDNIQDFLDLSDEEFDDLMQEPNYGGIIGALRVLGIIELKQFLPNSKTIIGKPPEELENLDVSDTVVDTSCGGAIDGEVGTVPDLQERHIPSFDEAVEAGRKQFELEGKVASLRKKLTTAENELNEVTSFINHFKGDTS